MIAILWQLPSYPVHPSSLSGVFWWNLRISEWRKRFYGNICDVYVYNTLHMQERLVTQYYIPTFYLLLTVSSPLLCSPLFYAYLHFASASHLQPHQCSSGIHHTASDYIPLNLNCSGVLVSVSYKNCISCLFLYCIYYFYIATFIFIPWNMHISTESRSPNLVILNSFLIFSLSLQRASFLQIL